MSIKRNMRKFAFKGGPKTEKCYRYYRNRYLHMHTHFSYWGQLVTISSTPIFAGINI